MSWIEDFICHGFIIRASCFLYNCHTTTFPSTLKLTAYSLSSAEETAVQPVATPEGLEAMAAIAVTSALEVTDPVDVAAGTTVTDVFVTMLFEMTLPEASLVTS